MATMTHLQHQVDEVLEPLWQQEHTQAKRRSVYVRIGQVLAGALIFVVVAVAVDLLVGVTVPWVAFVCITLVAMALSVGGRSDPFDEEPSSK